MNKDRYLSLFYIALGFLIIYLSSQIKSLFAVLSEDTGPKFFPYLCGILMTVCGACKFISSKGKKAKEFVKTPKDWLRILFISAILIAYVCLLKYLGYILSSIALLTVLAYLLADEKKLKWWYVAIFSIAVVAVVYIGFYYVLNISLPEGIWIKALRKALR
jgi:hypothetical protein